MEILTNNWELFLIGVLVIDKIVALSPTPYDDMIWTTIKNMITKATGRRYEYFICNDQISSKKTWSYWLVN